jgi:hypothetical protein
MSAKFPEIGAEIAENPREKLILETIKSTKDTLLRLELQLELQRSGLEYLQELVVGHTE